MIRLYAYGAALVMLAGLAWYAHSTVWDAGYQARSAEINQQIIDARIAEQQAERKAQQATAPIVIKGRETVKQTQAATRETVRYITQVIHDSPANALCVAHPDIVRSLKASADQARAAASSL